MKVASEYKIPHNIGFHELFIPTADSIKFTYLSKTLITHECGLLLYGKTGTGKTLIIRNLLLNDIDSGIFVPTITVFSANTTAS